MSRAQKIIAMVEGFGGMPGYGTAGKGHSPVGAAGNAAKFKKGQKVTYEGKPYVVRSIADDGWITIMKPGDEDCSACWKTVQPLYLS